MRLTRNLVGKPYHVYCDHFFTSLPLFTDLLKDGIYVCGTYNPQRKFFPKDIRPLLKKEIGNRGSTFYREREQALLTVWQVCDNVVNKCPTKPRNSCIPKANGRLTCTGPLPRSCSNLQPVHRGEWIAMINLEATPKYS